MLDNLDLSTLLMMFGALVFGVMGWCFAFGDGEKGLMRVSIPNLLCNGVTVTLLSFLLMTRTELFFALFDGKQISRLEWLWILVWLIALIAHPIVTAKARRAGYAEYRIKHPFLA